MVEILKRKITAKHEILLGDHVQIGINDYGHLTIRYFNLNNQKVDTKKEQTEDEDVLIVFEAEATRKLQRFLRNMRDC